MKSLPFDEWREPKAVTALSTREGVAFGLWEGARQEEVVAPAPLSEWLVSLPLTPLDLVVWRDGRVTTEGSVVPGAIEIMAPGELPRAEVRSQRFRYCRLSIPEASLSKLAELWKLPVNRALSPIPFSRGTSSLLQLAQMASQTAIQTDPWDGIAAEHLTNALLAAIFQSSTSRSSSVGRERTEKLSPSNLRKAKELLMNFRERVTLSDLSDELGLSAFHICRAFCAATGLPPRKWRLQQQMLQASALLAGTEIPVSTVANQVGFFDPACFSASFKRAIGVSPSEFRNRSRH